MIPVLFIAAGVSVPVTVVLNLMMLRREKRFAVHMKSVGTLIPWLEAHSRVECGAGSFIG